MTISPSRRTIVKGAAWTAPVLTAAAAAPALAASPACTTTYQSITKSFTYRDALGNDVIVEVTAENVPLQAAPGATLEPISTSSKVTISSASADLLKSFLLGNPATIGGTSTSTSTLSGAYSGSTTTPLTIAEAPAPPAGQPLITTASGTGSASAVPADATPGTVTITMGSPASTLIGYRADGSQSGTYNSTLTQIDGNDYTLGTFTICG